MDRTGDADLTGDELKEARHRLGLSITEFCDAFGVANERTVRGWELGFRGDIPAPVPKPVALLVRLALEFPAVRHWLGIPEQRNHPRSPRE